MFNLSLETIVLLKQESLPFQFFFIFIIFLSSISAQMAYNQRMRKRMMKIDSFELQIMQKLSFLIAHCKLLLNEKFIYLVNLFFERASQDYLLQSQSIICLSQIVGEAFYFFEGHQSQGISHHQMKEHEKALNYRCIPMLYLRQEYVLNFAYSLHLILENNFPSNKD